jgi:hypothetical protein
LTIGGGQVFPEVNFTLPPMNMTNETWPDVLAHYEQMAEEILRRAAALATPGLVLEFELLPPMTERPEWGPDASKVKMMLNIDRPRGTGNCNLFLLGADAFESQAPNCRGRGPSRRRKLSPVKEGGEVSPLLALTTLWGASFAHPSDAAFLSRWHHPSGLPTDILEPNLFGDPFLSRASHQTLFATCKQQPLGQGCCLHIGIARKSPRN